MESLYNAFAGVIPGVPGWLLFWLVAVLAIALIVFSFKMTTHNTDPSTRGVSKAIKKLGTETVSDVVFADEIEGPIHIEHLCLTPTGIAVVDIKDYRGYLFGGANTDQWTQVIDNRSYRFENPLYHNKDRVRAIEALVDDEVPIFGCVVFTNAGSFPKDKPEGVVMQDNLQEGLGLTKAADIPSRYHSEWENLLQRLQSNGGEFVSSKA